MKNITDPKTAEFFCDTESVRHLGPFLARECTLRDAAMQLEISPQRMSYWINKLIKFGFIEFVRFEKQGRHQASVYRSTYDEYSLPLSAVNEATAMALLQAIQGRRFDQLQRSIARVFVARSRNARLRIWRSEHGPFSRVENPENSEDFFGLTSEFRPLTLMPEEIEELHKELRAFVARWLERSSPIKTHKALLYCGFAEDPVSLAKL